MTFQHLAHLDSDSYEFDGVKEGPNPRTNNSNLEVVTRSPEECLFLSCRGPFGWHSLFNEVCRRGREGASKGEERGDGGRGRTRTRFYSLSSPTLPLPPRHSYTSQPLHCRVFDLTHSAAFGTIVKRAKRGRGRIFRPAHREGQKTDRLPYAHPCR